VQRGAQGSIGASGTHVPGVGSCVRPYPGGRRRALRYLTLIVVACLLPGCATDVAMHNPRTGDTTTCRATLWGLNPWSQQDACIADHIAQGWRRTSPE